MPRFPASGTAWIVQYSDLSYFQVASQKLGIPFSYIEEDGEILISANPEEYRKLVEFCAGRKEVEAAYKKLVRQIQ